MYDTNWLLMTQRHKEQQPWQQSSSPGIFRLPQQGVWNLHYVKFVALMPFNASFRRITIYTYQLNCTYNTQMRITEHAMNYIHGSFCVLCCFELISVESDAHFNTMYCKYHILSRLCLQCSDVYYVPWFAQKLKLPFRLGTRSWRFLSAFCYLYVVTIRLDGRIAWGELSSLLELLTHWG